MYRLDYTRDNDCSGNSKYSTVAQKQVARYCCSLSSGWDDSTASWLFVVEKRPRINGPPRSVPFLTNPVLSENSKCKQTTVAKIVDLLTRNGSRFLMEITTFFSSLFHCINLLTNDWILMIRSCNRPPSQNSQLGML